MFEMLTIAGRLQPHHTPIYFYRDAGGVMSVCLVYCGEWCVAHVCNSAAQVVYLNGLTGVTPFMKQSWFGLK